MNSRAIRFIKSSHLNKHDFNHKGMTVNHLCNQQDKIFYFALLYSLHGEGNIFFESPAICRVCNSAYKVIYKGMCTCVYTHTDTPISILSSEPNVLLWDLLCIQGTFPWFFGQYQWWCLLCQLQPQSCLLDLLKRQK